MQNDLDKRIQERAYEIWESEGQPQGRSEQHWAQARAEFADAAEATAGEAAAQPEAEGDKPPRKTAKRAATGAPVTGKTKSAGSAKPAATGLGAKRPRKP